MSRCLYKFLQFQDGPQQIGLATKCARSDLFVLGLINPLKQISHNYPLRREEFSHVRMKIIVSGQLRKN